MSGVLPGFAPGFAHGFYVLSDWAEVIYKATDYYAPKWERTLLWNDPEVGIEWPLIPGKEPVISTKDTHGKRLAEAEIFTIYGVEEAKISPPRNHTQ